MIDHETTALANRLFFRLFQAGNVLQRQVQNEMGLSTVQWAVLGALTRPGYEQGVSFNELTEYLVVSRQNLDGVLKRLERVRHVQRIPHPDDGRARLVILTEQGKVFWENLQTRIAEFYEQGIVGFGFDEVVTLLHGINKLEKNLAQIKIEDKTLA